MTDKKMQILYTIKGIQPYDPIEGYVAILLSPVDNIQHQGMKTKPRINMGMVGPGGPVPQEVLDQLQDMVQSMTGSKRRSPEKDREIILIESEILFQKRGWRYGDTITATFDKLDD